MLALPQALRACCAAARWHCRRRAGPVWAQGKLEARYTASLAGIPIGKGSWVIDITDTITRRRRAAPPPACCMPSPAAQGTSAAHGTLQAGQPLSSIYASTIVTSKKTDEVRLTIDNGNVKEFKRRSAAGQRRRSACRSPRRTGTACSIR